MYKVFFNGSTIQIGYGKNKSLNSNIADAMENESYDAVNQLMLQMESAESSSDFFFLNQDEDTAWNLFRSHFVEIPAAGGLVQNPNGSILCIRRLGVWDLPKGKIEENETPEFAAIREVEEECGLSGLQVLRQLDSTFHIYRSPYLPFPKNLVLKETKWFLMSYSGVETPMPQIEENIEEVRWFAVSELDEVLKDTYSSLREFLEKTLIAI